MLLALQSPARRALLAAAATAVDAPLHLAEAAADALLDPTPFPPAPAINAELRSWHRVAAHYVPAGLVLRAARSLPIPMTDAVLLVLEIVFRAVLPPPGTPHEQRREFLRLAVSEGVPPNSIAFALGMKANAVRMALARASKPPKPKRETFADRQRALYAKFPDIHHLVLDEIATAVLKLHRPPKAKSAPTTNTPT